MLCIAYVLQSHSLWIKEFHVMVKLIPQSLLMLIHPNFWKYLYFTVASVLVSAMCQLFGALYECPLKCNVSPFVFKSLIHFFPYSWNLVIKYDLPFQFHKLLLKCFFELLELFGQKHDIIHFKDMARQVEDGKAFSEQRNVLQIRPVFVTIAM